MVSEGERQQIRVMMVDVSPESRSGRLGPHCKAGDVLRDRAEQKVLDHGKPQ